MKNVACLIIILFCFSWNAGWSQSDCFSAAPFCTSTGVTFPAETGNGNAPAGPNYDCLFTTPNPAWYYLNISQSGNINITLTNSNLVDVDFILWGPFNTQAAMCTAIFNQTAGIEDCSYLTDATEYVDITGAIVGQWYMFLITNYSDQPTNIIATQTGGTGATNCAILCTFNGINATPGPCDPATESYNVNGTITVTNPPSTGTLTISNSCGGTPITMNPPFANSIPYSFTGLTAAGGPCSITATFTADPTCTGTANYTAPGPCNTTPCNLDFFEANISACDGTTGGYDITGTIQFSNAPTSGQLIVETCGGQQVTFNAPFVSPLNYTIPGIVADGLPCTINCYFTADPACGNSIDFTAPAPCGCSVSTGTYTVNQNGDSNTNNYLCWNDDLAITSNGDFIYPPNVNDLNTPYNPGLWWLIFSCPPTIPAGADIENDPCLVGTVSSADLLDLNNGAILSSFPAGTFTNNTVYFVPITMYDVTGGWYSVTNFEGNCYDLGQTYVYTYLPELTNGIETQDCQAQTLSVSFQGGAAELLGSNLTATNLTPANAFFVTDVIANGGSMMVGGLLDGDVVSFTVSDQYGCPIVYTSAPFVGPTIPTITPQNSLCINDPAVQLIATPTGGTWSGTGVTSNGIFDPALAGIGPETISYLPAGCALSDNITIQVTGPTDATITNPGEFCVNGTPFQLVAASPGGTWSGNGVSPSGLFDPAVAGVTTTTITYTIPGNCGDTDTQDIVVNALPNVSFTSDVTSGCTPLVVNFTNTSIPVGNGCTWWVNGVPSGNNCGSLITSFDTPGCYDIMLSTQDANGCVNSATITDMVCALAPPEASFTFEPLQPTVNNSTVQFIDLSLGASDYLWTFMNIYNFTAASPVFTFPNEEAGEYLVCLLVTNAAGCTDTECATVTVQDELVVYIPNTFTPTGDNINEYFKPSIKGESLILTYEFNIFNRWGDAIFSTKDPSEGWNGNVKGGGYYAQDGVYAWKLRLKTNNGQEPLEWEGHVTILR
ncbi:MAG: hypothetical protein RL092_1420 [Bacteroidota bacterium]|jgi:gliding motility-associated-like protein